MGDPDIRWIQQFKHYQKALRQLESSTELSRQRSLSNLEKQGGFLRTGCRVTIAALKCDSGQTTGY